MLLSELKISFVEALQEHYPPQEINSFFYWLTQEYLDLTRFQVALAIDKQLDSEVLSKFEQAIRRLKGYEPIQYIVGKTEFYGLEFKVNSHVLIPRPETEELVDWILQEVAKKQKPLRILDIGTGSGCIAVTLAKHLPQTQVWAIDVSMDALEVARTNADLNDVKVSLLHQNVLELEKLQGTFDVIVSNPPYVRESERTLMQDNVLRHEPAGALWVSDEQPLIFYEKITRLASEALVPGGKLFFEINEALGTATARILKASSFGWELRKDLFDKDRMLMGQLIKE